MTSHKTAVASGTTTVSGPIEMYISNDGGSSFRYAETIYSTTSDGAIHSWYKVIEHASGMIKFKWVGGSTSTITFQVDKHNW